MDCWRNYRKPLKQDVREISCGYTHIAGNQTYMQGLKKNPISGEDFSAHLS